MENLEPDTLVPMYFEPWTHFTEDGKALEDIFSLEALRTRSSGWLLAKESSEHYDYTDAHG